MKKARTRSVAPLLVATSLAAAAPAWAQDNSNEAVLKRIEALSREIEQLKAQVQASNEKAAKGPIPIGLIGRERNRLARFCRPARELAIGELGPAENRQ